MLDTDDDKMLIQVVRGKTSFTYNKKDFRIEYRRARKTSFIFFDFFVRVSKEFFLSNEPKYLSSRVSNVYDT